MYSSIHDILCDKSGGEIFTCFGVWHFVYIFIAVAAALAVFFAVRKKTDRQKDLGCEVFIDIAFGLYMADFFLMPFAYEYIDIEKLPFHICTAMCLACFLSRRIKALKGLSIHFALLGFISNLVYLIYPAGVMWHAVHPLCYRVVQTLLFHGVMAGYGFLMLAFRGSELGWKSLPKDLAVISGMTLWAVIGNLFYTGSAGAYSNDFNWFFVTGDPFGILDRSVAPFIMPFVNIAVFFAVGVLVRIVVMLAERKKKIS